LEVVILRGIREAPMTVLEARRVSPANWNMLSGTA